MNATTRTGLLVFVTLALGGLGYVQYGKLTAAQAELAEAKVQLEETLSRANRLPAERERKETLLRSSAELSRTLPEREQFGSLLRSLRLTAADHNLSVTNVTRKADASPLPGITAINLDFTVNGAYPGIQAFLEDLGHTQRALTVTNGNLEATQDGVNSTLKLTAYARNVPVPKTPDPSPGASGVVTPSPTPTTTPSSTPTSTSPSTPNAAAQGEIQ